MFIHSSYNYSMETKIKRLVSELMQPVFDQLVDTCCGMFKSISDNLPADMPDSEKEKIVNQILDAQAQSIVASIKSIVPEDFADKLKEAANGRK